jgi:GNAT superfamily N-acetyltransferase
VTISLRCARSEDAYALWIWANDPATRAASFNRGSIVWEDHLRWLDHCLEDPGHVILLAELTAACPAGSVRFETPDGWKSARVSYVLAPEARGRGLSRPLLTAGVDWIRKLHFDVALWGDVAKGNARSLHLFRQIGWAEQDRTPESVQFWQPVPVRNICSYR